MSLDNDLTMEQSYEEGRKSQVSEISANRRHTSIFSNQNGQFDWKLKLSKR